MPAACCSSLPLLPARAPSPVRRGETSAGAAGARAGSLCPSRPAAAGGRNLRLCWHPSGAGRAGAPSRSRLGTREESAESAAKMFSPLAPGFGACLAALKSLSDGPAGGGDGGSLCPGHDSHIHPQARGRRHHQHPTYPLHAITLLSSGLPAPSYYPTLITAAICAAGERGARHLLQLGRATAGVVRGPGWRGRFCLLTTS